MLCLRKRGIESFKQIWNLGKKLDYIRVILGNSKLLTEYLLSRHNPRAPPDNLVHVYYELELVHILGIDELRQTMTALVYVDQVLVLVRLTGIWKYESFRFAHNGEEKRCSVFHINFYFQKGLNQHFFVFLLKLLENYSIRWASHFETEYRKG